MSRKVYQGIKDVFSNENNYLCRKAVSEMYRLLSQSPV